MTSSGLFRVPVPVNEPIRGYTPGSPARRSLQDRLAAMAGTPVDMPLVIGGRDVDTGRAWPEWSRLPWTERASVFLRAADLLAGPWRDTLNAATMLGQSKTAHQAEIDAACELCDFLRFNVAYMTRIYEEQPMSASGAWNRMEYRPLEGFVFAVSPFNFTAIAGNLTSSAA